MRKKKRWWTIQFIPHGKGKVQTFKIKLFPMIMTILLLFTTMILAYTSAYLLWQLKKSSDQKIIKQDSEMDHYITENQDLREEIDHLNQELVDLHEDVQELQNFIEEVQTLEQQIQGLDGTSHRHIEQTEDDDERIKNMLSVASYDIEAESTSPDEIRQQIETIKEEAVVQQENLEQLKEEIKEEQYRAQFIPSIAPSNGRLTSPFGWRRDPFNGSQKMHAGIDFASHSGTPIYVTANGIVKSAGWHSGYGKHIEVDHGNGYVTTYSHLSSMDVSAGESVERGDVIGKMGSTGRSTGVHLHYEVHKNGTPVNPMPYIRGGN
ncbi:peptidoglycan DD-metalloendopeptidase family protein [Caldalkalibacillus salinus]|uniref:peptidoglycan DD-metalloendopeptidase family protein n=1 Tax=Caldalkalibacillus salinus TaxID=2803787 RepID=UPI001F466AD5|nr:peptidoglycan DD-metalloendopeptidase family protein [Caldalkalibacillus salinus]